MSAKEAADDTIGNWRRRPFFASPAVSRDSRNRPAANRFRLSVSIRQPVVSGMPTAQRSASIQRHHQIGADLGGQGQQGVGGAGLPGSGSDGEVGVGANCAATTCRSNPPAAPLYCRVAAATPWSGVRRCAARPVPRRRLAARVTYSSINCLPVVTGARDVVRRGASRPRCPGRRVDDLDAAGEVHLYPLSPAGLGDAVIRTPAAASRRAHREREHRVGGGRGSNTTESLRRQRFPRVRANSSEWWRASRPTTTVALARPRARSTAATAQAARLTVAVFMASGRRASGRAARRCRTSQPGDHGGQQGAHLAADARPASVSTSSCDSGSPVIPAARFVTSDRSSTARPRRERRSSRAPSTCRPGRRPACAASGSRRRFVVRAGQPGVDALGQVGSTSRASARSAGQASTRSTNRGPTNGERAVRLMWSLISTGSPTRYSGRSRRRRWSGSRCAPRRHTPCGPGARRRPNPWPS